MVMLQFVASAALPLAETWQAKIVPFLKTTGLKMQAPNPTLG
uniref:Uncharacterized protein n=1 Tax=Candidozyma auris TaxID=498019 RepID=A0A0L0P4Y7_CANAR